MNLQSIKSKAMSHKLMASALVLLMAGAGTAAVTTLVSTPTDGTVTTTKGMSFNITDASSNVNIVDDNTYSVDLSSGGEFSTSHVKRNLANDETGALVEYYVLHKDGQDLQKENLENVSFMYKTTKDSTVDHGGPYVDWISRYSDGTIRKDTGNVLHVGEADIRGDSSQDVVVCIGSNPGKANEYTADGTETDGDIDEGVNFDSGEEWKVKYGFNTQNTFPDTSIQTSAGIASLFNPQTGSLSPVAQACPQFK